MVIIFFQIILHVERNLRKKQWQLGLLRAMGMNKQDMLWLMMLETLSLSIASVLLGFILGYAEVLIGVSLV